MKVLHGNGFGGFAHSCDIDDIYNTSLSVVWTGLAGGHLNGGTKLDLAITAPGNSTSDVRILLGDGAGGFQYDPHESRYRIGVPGGLAMQALCVDLDQNGFDDIVTSNNEEVGQTGV